MFFLSGQPTLFTYAKLFQSMDHGLEWIIGILEILEIEVFNIEQNDVKAPQTKASAWAGLLDLNNNHPESRIAVASLLTEAQASKRSVTCDWQ